jgi:hypothetical protein
MDEIIKDNLFDMIEMLEWFERTFCVEGAECENYRVHTRVMRQLAETRLLALQRSERQEKLSQIDNEKNSLLRSKPGRTDQRTSLQSEAPSPVSPYEFGSQSSPSL